MKDGLYTVEITRQRDVRSAKQNRLFHKWMGVMEKKSHVGYYSEEWKQLFASVFLREEKETPLGMMSRIRSTTELDTKEFSEFMKNVQMLASTPQLGSVDLRFPDDLGFEQWVKSLED